MKNKNLVSTLIILYIVLLSLSLVIFLVTKYFLSSPDQGIVVNLMIWTATLFPVIALVYTYNSWRDQKGSEVLSNISKDCYKDLDNLKDLMKETTTATSYQFRVWVISEDPMKNYNNKYQYMIDELNEKFKDISRTFEIIKRYKSKDHKFKQLVNIFDGNYRSLNKILKKMDIVIGTTEMAKEYKQIGINDTENAAIDLLNEFDSFIDIHLKEYLIDYIFCIK